MFKRLAIILLFALIASPFLFKTVSGLLGNWVSNASGSPTPAGLLLHGLVFLLLSTVVLRSVREGIRNYAEPSEAYGEGYAEAVEEKYAEELYAEEPYEEYR
jgi:membrane protein implicated in regulation of membrane protease activity